MTQTDTPTVAQAIAAQLKQRRAWRVIGVLQVLKYHPDFRGKVNLGKATGARGDNSRAARPVDRAQALGLITGRQDLGRGNCYIYNLTPTGREVATALEVSR